MLVVLLKGNEKYYIFLTADLNPQLGWRCGHKAGAVSIRV
jgi:hypothetical protein